MAFNFATIFGGGKGGLEHSGGGRVVSQNTAHPTQQLETGNGAPVGAGGAPTQPQQTEQQPDPINSHLEQLGKVWQTATTPDGKPITPAADPLATPLFQFDPAKVQEAASKLDFTSNINPELVTKALGGDAQALMDVINGAVRTAFTAQTLNMGNVLNDGFSRHGKAIDQALPSRLRTQAIVTAQSDDPILAHPSMAPILAGLKLTIAQNNPNMPAADVNKAAEEYLKGVGTAFNMKQGQQQEQKVAAEETDWLTWAKQE